MQSESLFKAFADGSRLKIIASLLDSPKFVEQLASQLNISVSTVSFHLKKLEAAGVVRARKEQYYQVYFVDESLINSTLASLLPHEQAVADGDAFSKSVIDTFFENGRVEKLPVQVKKREVIYRAVAEKFDFDRAYSHGEANVIIADIIDDFITAKKEMLSMGLLVEKGGTICRFRKKSTEKTEK